MSDQGVGIARTDAKRIFERFERAVSDSYSTNFGLGLWISRQIVEAHGGAIDVVSRPNSGATFTVTLPREAPLIESKDQASIEDADGSLLGC